MNLLAKMGLVAKHLQFFLIAGTNNFTQIADIVAYVPPPPTLAASLSDHERQAAVAKALLHPQAIFHGDCAACHSTRGQNAYGENLYAADCGICHESAHRASAVPDLHALKQPTDFAYWKTNHRVREAAHHDAGICPSARRPVKRRPNHLPGKLPEPYHFAPPLPGRYQYGLRFDPLICPRNGSFREGRAPRAP